MSIPKWWRITIHRTALATISRIRCSINRRIAVKRELIPVGNEVDEVATIVIARPLVQGEILAPVQTVSRNTLVTTLAMSPESARALAQALADVGYRPHRHGPVERVEVIDVEFEEVTDSMQS